MILRVMTALAVIALLCFAQAAASPPAGMQLPPQPKVRPAGMPAGYVMVSPCIRQMGEHWANPSNLMAPIYGTWKGKIIFSEIMIPLKTLQSGMNYPDLGPLPGHTIDHVALGWEPKGHEGMPVPHYDIHAYYISLCPGEGGLPERRPRSGHGSNEVAPPRGLPRACA